MVKRPDNNIDSGILHHVRLRGITELNSRNPNAFQDSSRLANPILLNSRGTVVLPKLALTIRAHAFPLHCYASFKSRIG